MLLVALCIGGEAWWHSHSLAGFFQCCLQGRPLPFPTISQQEALEGKGKEFTELEIENKSPGWLCLWAPVDQFLSLASSIPSGASLYHPPSQYFFVPSERRKQLSPATFLSLRGDCLRVLPTHSSLIILSRLNFKPAWQCPRNLFFCRRAWSSLNSSALQLWGILVA